MVRFILKTNEAGWEFDTIEEVEDKISDILNDFEENEDFFLKVKVLDYKHHKDRLRS